MYQKITFSISLMQVVIYVFLVHDFIASCIVQAIKSFNYRLLLNPYNFLKVIYLSYPWHKISFEPTFYILCVLVLIFVLYVEIELAFVIIHIGHLKIPLYRYFSCLVIIVTKKFNFHGNELSYTIASSCISTTRNKWVGMRKFTNSNTHRHKCVCKDIHMNKLLRNTRRNKFSSKCKLVDMNANMIKFTWKNKFKKIHVNKWWKKRLRWWQIKHSRRSGKLQFLINNIGIILKL